MTNKKWQSYFNTFSKETYSQSTILKSYEDWHYNNFKQEVFDTFIIKCKGK